MAWLLRGLGLRSSADTQTEIDMETIAIKTAIKSAVKIAIKIAVNITTESVIKIAIAIKIAIKVAIKIAMLREKPGAGRGRRLCPCAVWRLVFFCGRLSHRIVSLDMLYRLRERLGRSRDQPKAYFQGKRQTALLGQMAEREAQVRPESQKERKGNANMSKISGCNRPLKSWI